MNSLVNFWRNPLDGPPYIHTEDKEALEAEGLANYFDCSTDTFESFVLESGLEISKTIVSKTGSCRNRTWPS